MWRPNDSCCTNETEMHLFAVSEYSCENRSKIEESTADPNRVFPWHYHHKIWTTVVHLDIWVTGKSLAFYGLTTLHFPSKTSFSGVKTPTSTFWECGDCTARLFCRFACWCNDLASVSLDLPHLWQAMWRLSNSFCTNETDMHFSLSPNIAPKISPKIGN